jgi:rubrerythrin
MAKSADSEASRAVFDILVTMERDHLDIFQNMLVELGNSRNASFLNDEHSDYVRTLAGSAVFTDDLITGDMATQADTDIKAIELGISAEKESLLFYYEIKDNLPKHMVKLLDKIIEEEKTHLQQLFNIKKELTSGL